MVQTNGTAEAVVLAVQRMTCAACERRVRSALHAHPGVRNAAIQLRSGRVEVEVERTLATPEQVAASVTRIGYPAAVVGAATKNPVLPPVACGCCGPPNLVTLSGGGRDDGN